MPSRTRQLRKRTGKSGQDSYETKESAELKRRVHKINKAIASEDVAELRRLAITGPGLINDGMRKLAWPLLLHCNNDKKIEKVADKHKQEEQVTLDVDRSFAHFRKGTRKITLKQNQHDLCDIIVQVLRRHPSLHYYQGFHDICSILLLVLGKEAAASAAENIAMFLLRDAMLDSFDVLLGQLTLLNTILLQEDKEIHQFLMACDLSPYFCISWVITWCSHDLRSLTKITRLFDFFISSNPLMSVYLAAKIVLNRREELLALDCDFAIVHSFLSRLPQNLQINELIRETQLLYEKYPASKIQKLSDLPLHP
ncbi:6295_t:CDS:2, partial [Paraglomus occultum]